MHTIILITFNQNFSLSETFGIKIFQIWFFSFNEFCIEETIIFNNESFSSNFMFTFPRCCLVEQFHSLFGLYVTRSDVLVVWEYLTLVVSLHWLAHIHLIRTHMPKSHEDMKLNIFYLIVHCGRQCITM